MFGPFWEMYQLRKIGDVQSSASRSEERVSDVSSQVRSLEERIDRLALACMAFWSLLQEVSELTEEDLLERMKEIDLTDGRLDGRVRQPAVTCPECNRVMSQKHRRCLYCGYEHASGGAFDGL